MSPARFARIVWFVCAGGLVATTGCASRAGAPFVAAPGTADLAAPAATGGTGRLTVRLPVIVPSSYIPVPGGTGLSSKTNAIAISVGKTSFTPITLTVASGRCINGPKGLACTVTVDAPAGTNTVAFTTFALRGAKKIELAVGSVKNVHLSAGKTTTISPSTFFGLAKNVGVTVSPKSLTQAGSALITAYGVDGAGGKIPAPGAYQPGYGQLKLAIELSGPYSISFGAQAPPTSETFGFNGGKSGLERILASDTSGGLSPGHGSLALTAILGPIVAALGNQTIAEFAPTASGNTAPLRTFSFAWGCWAGPTAPDTDGNFWIPCNASGDATHVRNVGQAIGSIVPGYGYTVSGVAFDAAAHEFLSEIVGSTTSGTGNCSATGLTPMIVEMGTGSTILRQLILPNTCIASLAVDSSDDIYAATYDESNATTQIVEYASTVSGYNPPPTRAISFPAGANAGIHGLACDTHGNVFAELGGNSVIEIPAAGTTYTTALSGPATFSLDTKNDVWAEVPTGTGSFAIEEFAPGTTTPIKTIEGSATGLTTPGTGIVYAGS